MRNLAKSILTLHLLAFFAGAGAMHAQTTGDSDRDLLKETIGENTAELEELRA